MVSKLVEKKKGVADASDYVRRAQRPHWQASLATTITPLYMYRMSFGGISSGLKM